MDITATDSAVETVCQALLACSSQFADALRHVSDPAAAEPERDLRMLADRMDPAAFPLASSHRLSPVRAALTGKIIPGAVNPGCCSGSSQRSTVSKTIIPGADGWRMEGAA